MEKNNSFIPLLARILISFIFIVSGISKIFGFSGTRAYMAMQGIPFTTFFLIGAIIIEVVGGFMLLFGYQTKIVSLVMFFYLIPVTLTIHHFWTYTGMQREENWINFMKNLAIMGGMLMLFYFGPGPKSIDKSLEKNNE